MGRRKWKSHGLIFVALGIGLIMSFVFPDKFIIVLLATALVICGASLCRA